LSVAAAHVREDAKGTTADRLPALSLTQWIVLAVLVEQPTHGFAIASLTTRTGELGQVWTTPRPLVYRALDDLVRLGLAREVRTERGENTLDRKVLSATQAGRSAVRTWLAQPAKHLRDLRSELLVKLALHARSGTSPRALLEAQSQTVAVFAEDLTARLGGAEAFQRSVLHWRLEQALSAQRFLEAEMARTDKA
jgi:PadR family transcriptional regulator AphA